jgi:hypothetical protein
VKLTLEVRLFQSEKTIVSGTFSCLNSHYPDSR